MGQTESTQAIYVKQWNKREQLKYSYIFHNSIEIYESQSNQLYALTVKLYNSDFYYIKELKRLDDYQKLQHIKGLLPILDIQKKEENSLCSKIYQISTTFQYGLPITMNNIQWDQFLMQAITILLQLKEKQIYHNDLTLQSFLLIDNQLHLTLPMINQYMKIVTNQNKIQNNLYLCPELCSNLLKKQYNPIFDREKADVYSLGLICLELCLKQSIQQIYQSDLTINQLMLDQLIDQSKMLIIQKMLTLKTEDRPDFKYLFEACLYEQTQITLKSRISPQVLKSLQFKSRVLQQSFNEPLKEVTRSIQLSHHTPKAHSTKAAYSNQCFFLHERIHIPVSPGENYLGSTPQQKKRKVQSSYSKRSSSKRKNRNI